LRIFATSRRTIFSIAFLGSGEPIRISFGTLKLASRAWQNARSWVASVLPLSRIAAQTSAPCFASGTPNIDASVTAGFVCGVCSISVGKIFSPPALDQVLDAPGYGEIAKRIVSEVLGRRDIGSTQLTAI
jgi:hypothetical protein